MTLRIQVALFILGLLVAVIMITNLEPKHLAVSSVPRTTAVKLDKNSYVSHIPSTVKSKSMFTKLDKLRKRDGYEVRAAYDIANDIDLDQKTRDEFLFLFSIAEREKDFLLNEVRISLKLYNEIKRQRQLVQWQLRDVALTQKAKGIDQEKTVQAILKNYAHWMQSAIGVGYYNKLLQISMPEKEEGNKN